MIRRTLILGILIVACRPASPPAAGDDVSPVTITQSLARHTDTLMAIPGVVGVGEGQLDGKPAIQIMVARRSPELDRRLPDQLDGFPVQVVETGVIRPQADSTRP